MLRVRRWAGLCALTLAIGGGGAAVPLAGSASAATTPVTMNHACALKSTGLMRYVSSTAQCTTHETKVNFVPGPVHVCIHSNRTVHLVAATSDCVPPVGVRALTLPSPTSRTYFCAVNATGVLSPVANGTLCPSGKFPVFVPIIPHQPPVLANIESSTVPYDAGTPAVPVTSTLTVSSVDDANLAGATVSISSGFASGEDTLAFTSANGITGSYNASTGVLTLSGTSSRANYQTALRSVTYNDPDGTNPTTGTRVISFQVTTGKPKNQLSNVVSRDIMVSSLPVISNIESTPLSYQAQAPPVQITATLTISDADDATMSGATASITSGFDSGADTLSFTNQNGITGSYDASTGVLTLTGNASIANYQAALRSVEFSTTDNSASPAARTVSFTVTDTDGASSTGTAQRTIDVSAAAAQPPTAVNQNYTAVGNTPLGVGTSPSGPAATVSGSLLDGDSDPDPSATLSVTANTTPANGSVSVNPDGTFTYVPDAGFSGTDSFQYTIAGSNDPSETATATVTITVGPLVWYVDDSLGAAGTGQSTAPFNTLAAANSAAGADSIVFLYQGNATYTGGVTMQSGESLWGQPNGLTVDTYTLVPAGGSTPAITNSGGDGIDLAENADVEGVNVTNPSGNGIAASGVNDATVGASTAVAISGAGGDGIHVSGGNGALDFAGASVTGSTGHSVSVAGRTGGTVSIGGSVTDHTTGIALSSNSGATISFGGRLTLSTGASTAFSATGGGTVTATGTGSTATTTTATAVDVENTTIGSGGLTFQSVSANGANPGIKLSSTGSSGGLTVTGTGSAGSGGTIQNSAGEGIMLASTTSPSFTDMVIENNAADGINGSQVNGLTLAGSTVSGNGTQANVTDEHNDDGLDFTPNGDGSPDGLTGTVSITGSLITGSAGDNAIISDTSGSLNLTVTGSTFSSNNATSGNYGLSVNANGSTSATVSVTGSTFTDNTSYDFQFENDFLDSSTATGTNSVTFSDNKVTGGGGVLFATVGGDTAITADGNNIQDPQDEGIGVDVGLEQGGTGTLSGTISGNTVGAPDVSNSGGGDGIGVSAEGTATETLAITNNNLYQYFNGAGINYLSREGSPTMNVTVTGNTVADPGEFGSWGILGDAGAETSDGGTVCAAISGNTLTGSGESPTAGVADFELDQLGNATYELPGYTGGATDTGAVTTFVQGNNISGSHTPTGFVTYSGPGGGFTGGSSCPAPS